MRIKPWAALLALALVAAACEGARSGAERPGEAGAGVKGGTLRVIDQNDVEAFDPGIAYGAADLALLRGVVRELYSYDTRLPDERATTPVPDLADGPYQLSADGRAYAFRYRPGPDYARHVVGSGPYTLRRYQPGSVIELVRNQNWDPRTDPLRSAWVDAITVRILGNRGGQQDIQRAIERGEADLNLDSIPPPNGDLQRLSGDPDLSRQFAVETTGCVHYLSLQMDSGPTRDRRVRQAINYAIDKQAVVLALGGRFAGDPASTILSPTLTGYGGYDLYPTPESRGDPDRAKALLARAGYPDGVTRWCPDFPGNGSRSFVGVLLDGRKITATANHHYRDYAKPRANTMIEQ